LFGFPLNCRLLFAGLCAAFGRRVRSPHRGRGFPAAILGNIPSGLFQFAVNAVQFPDALSLEELAFYVVAGVRDGIQGSVGQDSLGQERSITSP